MGAFAIGFAVFGATVCASALINERRRRVVAGDGPTRSRRADLDNLTKRPSMSAVDDGTSSGFACRKTRR
jgi:hypothetical protein